MKIFNTYSNQLEEFVPLKAGEVSMYICGPTVYNYIHIGNARPIIVFDVVRRYFEHMGYKVRFASNFTDVDDKIIDKALATGEPETKISSFFIDQYLKDVENLGSKTDYLKPRVTEYMQDIIAYIQELVAQGFAYEVHGDVYFRVWRIPEYGTLSNRKLDDLISGARVEVNPDKENPLDFALWKKTTEGLNWDSPFSKGRPGWHTECAVMIDGIFGGEIDIHGGGSDLIFPHHENEIAQAEACHHHHIARYWMHNGRLNLEGEKMSKSLGNVILVKDLGENTMPFRMLMLSTHYRAPLNFSDQNLQMYETEWSKVVNAMQALARKIETAPDSEISPATKGEADRFRAEFDQVMAMDFNTPNAITSLQGLLKVANLEMRQKNNTAILKSIEIALAYMLDILGLDARVRHLSSEDKALFRQWETLRKNKEFAAADSIRAELQERNLL